ncbi:hypothetical protein HDU97_002378 [Phlyctochytrium planicorne]|nr:hypothetical protein HDU97_002378 [Phlyctochytrium planicorne]
MDAEESWMDTPVNFINLYTLTTTTIWLTMLWQEETHTHNTVTALILFSMVLIGEFGDRLLVVQLARVHVRRNRPRPIHHHHHSRAHSRAPSRHSSSSSNEEVDAEAAAAASEESPLLHNNRYPVFRGHRRRYDPAPPPRWSPFATVLTLLGGPPGAYLWFELSDRWGPRRGFVRRYRFVITFFTSVFRGLFIAAMVVSISIDPTNCNILIPVECKEDALRIIFAIVAIIISSITAVTDLLALILTFFGIRLGLQKGEEDEDEGEDEDDDDLEIANSPNTTPAERAKRLLTSIFSTVAHAFSRSSPQPRSPVTTLPSGYTNVSDLYAGNDEDVNERESQPGSPPSLDDITPPWATQGQEKKHSHGRRREWKVFRRAYSSSDAWVVPVGINPFAQDVVEGMAPAAAVDLLSDQDLVKDREAKEVLGEEGTSEVTRPWEEEDEEANGEDSELTPVQEFSADAETLSERTVTP